MKVKVLIDDWYNVGEDVAWGKVGDVLEIFDKPYVARLLSGGFVAPVPVPPVPPAPEPDALAAKAKFRRG